jgi:hypothetical protein
MAQRVRTQGRDATEEPELESLPPPPVFDEALRLPTVDGVQTVLDGLRTDPGNQDLAGELNELLGRLAPGEDEGRLLLRVLGDGSLSGLVDAHGAHCRREAVRALLRLGFPWALEIDPDTLQWFRQVEKPARSSTLKVALVLLLTLLGGGVLAWQLTGSEAERLPPPPTQPALPPLPREVGALPQRFQDCADGDTREGPVTTAARLHISPAGKLAAVSFPDGRSRPVLARCLQYVGKGLQFEPAAGESELLLPLVAATQ